jgi:hypothetical protein
MVSVSPFRHYALPHAKGNRRANGVARSRGVSPLWIAGQTPGYVPLFWLTTADAQGNVKGMDLTVHIPDDIAERLGGAVNGDLSRRALEALSAEEYRLGHLNKPDLRRLLGFETSYQIDGFLKSHNVYENYTMEDFEDEREALRSLGF